MSTEFTLLPEHEAVLIKIEGQVSAADIVAMRVRTVELATETSYHNFIMDISEMMPIEGGSTFAAYELGNNFRKSGFPYQTRTAVIMPSDPAALEQAEFLHTVENNRGRGAMCYVESIDEATFWFRSTPVVD